MWILPAESHMSKMAEISADGEAATRYYFHESSLQQIFPVSNLTELAQTVCLMIQITPLVDWLTPNAVLLLILCVAHPQFLWMVVI